MAITTAHGLCDADTDDLVEINREVKKVTEECRDLVNQIQAIRTSDSARSVKVDIFVESTNADASGGVELSYVVTGASWRPHYDLMRKDMPFDSRGNEILGWTIKELDNLPKSLLVDVIHDGYKSRNTSDAIASRFLATQAKQPESKKTHAELGLGKTYVDNTKIIEEMLNTKK